MPAARASSSPTSSARDRLLDAATELFATRGYQAIGLRDLAGYVGLHAGSLYHHIENKQCLLFELIESALSDLLIETKRRMKGAKTNADRLRRFVHAFVAFQLTEKHRLALVAREFVNLSEEHKHQANQLKDAYAALLSAIIATDHGEQGRLDGQICLITNAVIGMLYGQSLWNNVEVSEQRLTEALTSFVIGIVASSKTTTDLSCGIFTQPS
ncbi:TetR/AcrR family transcriptional regulator [Pseudomonas sp. LS1212]|uniref:TetR/AcrR family transcriptional regulator n=1 Tax=Pseudomonas sp. LS1212 TaxID=2972478 RepID=UPI00215C3787|nr:TetR/AcrR family transcriptional regulator [Pseudomonas sp. LS1212]UVJ46239.1 TetR/AcrR family transcriptional regulator [Pseudomonas sp. LS1212]